jgi:hypothetical protein
MFRWYQQAAICYAFLEDVQDAEELADARWFTRGWTLQELIAPERLTFYNSAWREIGTREDWVYTISDITGIDLDALYGANSLSYIRDTSLAKRIAWAANRVTTRDEDIAYCLVGLLGINMPLLYGEGGIKAFSRLQEECIKVKLDQSFLTWLDCPDDERRGDLDVKFFARHPKDFQECNRISMTGDDVAPFSLNNKGLQIRLPVFQDKSINSGRTPEFLAILACYPENRPGFRIGIPLCAVGKSCKTFTFSPNSSHRIISASEFSAARPRDCCILRTSKYLTRQLLAINNRSSLLHSWRPEVFHLDPSKPTCAWEPLVPGRAFIPIPEYPRQTSYGVLFHHRLLSQELKNNNDDQSHLKILVRVDIGIEARYNVNLGTQLLYVPGTASWIDPSDIPSLRPSEKVSKSRSQTISIPTQQPEILTASASWMRISNQDVLFLDINSITVDEYRARRPSRLINRASRFLLLSESLIPILCPIATIIVLVYAQEDIFKADSIKADLVKMCTTFVPIGAMIMTGRLRRLMRSEYMGPSIDFLPQTTHIVVWICITLLKPNNVVSKKWDIAVDFLFTSSVFIGLELFMAMGTYYFPGYERQIPAER